MYHLADFLAGFYQPFGRFSRQQIPDQKLVWTVFQHENVYPFFMEKYTSSLWRFQLGNTKKKHNWLPVIIWNFYYDATKLLQADICIIITSN